MAENKKSFVAYSDWHGMFKALPDDVAGKLIKHIFSYVNDENPSSDDFVINALFEQIKATLKRDLAKWDLQREQRSFAGKKSAELRSTKSNERSTVVNENERNPTVNVSVSDSVNVSDNVNESITLKKSVSDIVDRKLKFASTLKPFVDIYGKQMLNEFYAYWTEPNKSNTKFKRELEKTWSLDRRLEKWAKNDRIFKKSGNGTAKQNADEAMEATKRRILGEDYDDGKPKPSQQDFEFTSYEDVGSI